MVNIGLLKQTMADSGMTTTAIAEKAGIQRETLYTKFNGVDFTASEVSGLIDALKLSPKQVCAIFFAKERE